MDGTILEKKYDLVGRIQALENQTFELEPATTETLGGIIVGDGLTIDTDGVLDLNLKVNGGIITDEEGEVQLDPTAVDFNTYNMQSNAPATRIGSYYDGTNSYPVYRKCYNIGQDIAASATSVGVGNLGNLGVRKVVSVRMNDGFGDVTTSFRFSTNNNMLYADNLVASAWTNPMVILEYVGNN